MTTDMFAHRRVIYPGPTGPVWRMGCSCGWLHEEPLTTVKAETVAEMMDLLDTRFVEHLAPGDHTAYVKVDARPGQTGAWLMPEGVPCRYSDWHMAKGVRYVRVQHPVVMTLPVGEVIATDGRIFRLS